MTSKKLSELQEAAQLATNIAAGRAQDYERHVETLLSYLASVASRYPDALTETSWAVSQSIAHDVGSFTEKTFDEAYRKLAQTRTVHANAAKRRKS